MNNTNYMAYYTRRKCIDKRAEISEFSFENELDFLDSLLMQAQKSYQYWHHRRVIVELSQIHSREKGLTNKLFESESKNFHAWCYRIWVVRRFNLFEGELDFIEEMLSKVGF